MNRKIQGIADYMAQNSFVSSFIRDDNLEQRQEDGLGIAISQWSEWDGLKIMRVFASALEDANFHTECAQVLEWVKGSEED